MPTSPPLTCPLLRQCPGATILERGFSETPRKNQQPEMQTAFQLSSDPFPSRRNNQVNTERCDFAVQACHVLPGGHHGSGPRCTPHVCWNSCFPAGDAVSECCRYRPLGTDFWGHHLLHGLPWCENPQQGSSPPSHAFHTMIF